MRAVPLLDVAPLASDRVRPFHGTRPYIATGGLDDDASLKPEHVTYEERPSRADLTVRTGDVCFARMKGTEKILEFAADHSDLILSTGFAVLRPVSGQLHSGFLRHWLCTEVFQSEKDRLCSGATQKAITNEAIGRLTIPFPKSVRDQLRIAEVLDRSEDLRATRRAALAQLDTLTQAIFLDLFGDPVVNLRRWPIKKLSNVGTLDRGVSKHRPRNAPELLGGPYPLVQTGEVANSDGYIRSHKSTYSQAGLRQSKMWPAGTLCITIAANIAKTGILTFDACFPDSVVGFCNEEQATVEFIRIWLSFLQRRLEEAAPESAQKNINLATLRDLDVPLPPIDRRMEFARRVAAVEKQKTTHRTSLAELDALFVAFQHRAFQGEL